MLKVYIAGAYSDDNVLSVLRNIGRGQEIAGEVFRIGYAPFCPWFDKEFVIQHWREDFDVQQFLDYSMAWLRASDCVLVVPNYIGLKTWRQSTGVMAEIEEAKRHGIPVYFSIEDMVRDVKNT